MDAEFGVSEKLLSLSLFIVYEGILPLCFASYLSYVFFLCLIRGAGFDISEKLLISCIRRNFVSGVTSCLSYVLVLPVVALINNYEQDLGLAKNYLVCPHFSCMKECCLCCCLVSFLCFDVFSRSDR